MTESKKPDEIIIDLILVAISTGRLNGQIELVDELKTLAHAIRSGDRNALTGLQRILSENTKFGEVAIECITDITLEFIASEVARFTRIRALRELTAAEKHYGLNTLTLLLRSLKALVGVDLPNDDISINHKGGTRT
ncbi:MAG: hypothetical protein ABI557_17670 [Aureliella sp.]